MRGYGLTSRAPRSSASTSHAAPITDILLRDSGRKWRGRHSLLGSYPRLERNAGRASRMIPITAAGALSKIELGLKWQGHYDWWKPYAWELM